MRAPRPLGRELLVGFGILFAGAVAILAMGLAFVLPVLATPGEVVLYTTLLVALDLIVLFAFQGALMRRLLVRPMEGLAGDARRIAEGDYHHRITPSATAEVEAIRESVNEMADRLIADQRLLAENVASLDHTNQELIEARDQIIHSARLASVGTLAAGIAHEVGNPLGAVMAFVDVAKSRVEREGGDTELLDSIRAEAKRIDRIVRGLLEYARPKDQEAEPSAPAEVVARVRDLLRTQGKLEAVEDTWVLPDEVPEVVMEPHRLEQVLVNLVLNALDALEGRPDPRLEVRLAVQEGDVAKLPKKRADDPEGINYMHRRRVSKDEGGWGVDPLFTARHVVVIEVADNGPGVPEEDREAIFDPFFTTKEPGQGTGLGLSICARLVEGMGGRIELQESEANGGARFIIRLPGYREAVA